MRPLLLRIIRLPLIMAWLLTSVAVADQSVDFNRDIRPLLSNHCWTCHGPDEEQRSTDLRLDTESGSRIDLGGYAAIVPHQPEASELLERIATDDPDLRMPPAGKGRRLQPGEIDLVRRWIEQGASYARHWAYEKPVRPPLPPVDQASWVRVPIDRFILAKLEAAGLQPSPEADRLTLARRAALDLTGLPPTWQEAKQFADDPSEQAFENYVDRLLAKPAFGERWARVWLDLARYADSAGYADDPPRTIWAYRDYVIRSLNANKPFDQFTIEQIAGDLLPNPTDEQLTATAFHRNTMTNNEGGTNDEEFRNVAVVDRVNTTMAVWMGTTMACAQCHTHKYDPITQAEYFQFFDFFNQTRDADQRDERPTIPVFSSAQRAEQQRLEEQIDRLQRILDQPTPELAAAQQRWLDALRAPPMWSPVVPSEAAAESRELTVSEDGLVTAEPREPGEAGGESPGETYRLQFPTASTGQLTGVRIEVPATQSNPFVLSRVRASWRPAGPASTEAKYIRVELPGRQRILHLAEIEAFRGEVNVARQGTASQSSTAYDAPADRAIDGNTDGNFESQSVTHTATEDNPWLEIELTESRPIDKLVLWNRTDGGPSISHRLAGGQLVLLDQDRNTVWRQTLSEWSEPSQLYRPDGTIELEFATATAESETSGFPAAGVLEGKSESPLGWTGGGEAGQSSGLTLFLAEPLSLAEGRWTLEMEFAGEPRPQVLDQFRVSVSAEPSLIEWTKIPEGVVEIVRLPPEQRNPQQRAELAAYYRSIAPLLDETRTELESARQQLAKLKPMTTVPVMQQVADAARRKTHVQLRGNYQSLAEQVTAGTPAAFHPLDANAPRDRLALARWLVDDDNPLTARVTVNRHWEEIFGTGIVETSEEFGSQGEPPSHPLLLDWLAVELQDHRWDLKHLLKLMVTSATYRQSSVSRESLREADPGNRLYARGPRFRISAEMVRDQALFVSGLLSDVMFGPPVRPPQPELGLKAAFGGATDWETSDGNDRYRRGIYTMWRRSNPYPSMAQFDAPNREVCTIRRIRTNTPLQALVTLNDPVYVEAAQGLARQMIAAGATPRQRIEYAMRACLTRDPTEGEVERLASLADQAWQHYRSQPEQAEQMATVPLGELPAAADPAEYAAWTVVGNVMLNLDEMFQKK